MHTRLLVGCFLQVALAHQSTTPLASLSVLAASPRQLHAQLSPLVCHTNASLALRLRVLPLVEMLESPLAQPPAWPTQAAAPLAYQSLIPLASQHVPAASLRQLHARLCRPAQLISVASLPSLLAPSLVVLASKPAWCTVQPCSQAQVRKYTLHGIHCSQAVID